LTKAIKIGVKQILGEVLLPQAWRQQVHLKGGMGVDPLEPIDQISIGLRFLMPCPFFLPRSSAQLTITTKRE